MHLYQMAISPSKDSSFHVRSNLEIQSFLFITSTTTAATATVTASATTTTTWQELLLLLGRSVCLKHGNKNTHIKCKPGET